MLTKWGYILPIEDRYWNRFCRLSRNGKTDQAYVLASDVLSINVKLLFFYSVHPFKEILGFADFVERVIGDSKELWASFGSETCLSSYDEYARLTRGKERVAIIRFRNLREASNVMTFDDASGILGTQRMSQIGMYVDKEQADALIMILNKQTPYTY